MQERLNYAWRIRSDGEFLLTGTYCSAYREARRRERYDEQLASFDARSNRELFVRAGPRRCRPRAHIHVPMPRYVEDRNRWGRVITRVQLRPLARPKFRRRGKTPWLYTRRENAKYVRQYWPQPNCFGIALSDWA